MVLSFAHVNIFIHSKARNDAHKIITFYNGMIFFIFGVHSECSFNILVMETYLCINIA